MQVQWFAFSFSNRPPQLRRLLHWSILILFTVYCTACHHMVRIGPAEAGAEEKIAAVVLLSGQTVRFDKQGAIFNPESQAIEGQSATEGRVSIPVADVLNLEVTRADMAGTIVLTAVILVAAAAVAGGAALAVAMNDKGYTCPFIYSYDGKRFQFDAEPLGGAICAGLARTDLSRLEHLRPSRIGLASGPTDGLVLLVRNEVEETQVLDAMRLVSVDSPPDRRAVVGAEGRIYLVGDPVIATSAVDGSGQDVSRFFREQDKVIWQSRFPVDADFDPLPVREELTFTFPRHVGSSATHLLLNAGDTLWGSHLIRVLLELQGKDVDAWYADVAGNGPQWHAMLGMFTREEMYHLKVDVWEEGAWDTRAVAAANGSLCIEDKLIPLDLAGVEGDSIRIRIRPPFGFWAIDQFVLVEDVRPATSVLPLEPVFALDSKDHSVLELLARKDGASCELPRRGDSFRIGFEMPSEPALGLKREWFLETTGYYELHLDRARPADRERLDSLRDVPGEIVRYSQELYRVWITPRAARAATG